LPLSISVSPSTLFDFQCLIVPPWFLCYPFLPHFLFSHFIHICFARIDRKDRNQLYLYTVLFSFRSLFYIIYLREFKISPSFHPINAEVLPGLLTNSSSICLWSSVLLNITLSSLHCSVFSRC
jgi:hypothetical protein